MTTERDNEKSALDQLKDRRRVFVLEYLRDFNGARAARAAGYAEKSAHVEASRLLRDEKVAKAIHEELDTRGVTPAKIKILFAEIAFGAKMFAFQGFFKNGDLEALEKKGINTGFVKSARITSNKHGTSYALELHSRLEAGKELVRVLGLASEGHRIEGGVGLSLVEVLARADELDREEWEREHKVPSDAPVAEADSGP